MNHHPSDQWLDWAIELQALAQAGLAYTPNIYDRERFERLRQIASEMIGQASGWPPEKVEGLFCKEAGYPTPKLDSRAAIVEDGKILLVQEKDGLWSMPGGWVDVNQTIRENTVKEVQEEAGLTARALRIVALQDRDKRNPPRYIYPICKVFVLCERLGGQFIPNSETIDSGFFSPDDLPPLSLAKTTRAQIEMCLQAAKDPAWQVQFD